MNPPAQPSPYGRGHRALEIASITFAFGSLSWIAYRITVAAHGVGDWIGIASPPLFGYIVSDFLSGFVHWAGDTVGDESTPIFGPNFVRPFRYHHVDPEDITRHDFVETNGNNCIVAAPVLMLVLVLLPATTGVLLLHVRGDRLHRAVRVLHQPVPQVGAHQEPGAAGSRLLQRAGLILSPEHHAIHHAAPRDKYYCITVGWMNPLLDKIRFFRSAGEGDRAHLPARAAPAPGRPPSE